MKERNMLINGEWIPAQSHNSFAVYNPATGAIVGNAPAGSARDAAAAIDAADDAFDGWAQMPAIQRAAILRRAADVLRSREEAIAELITLEAGKILRASKKEVSTAAEFINWFAEEGRRSYGEWIPDPLPYRRLLAIRQPVGIVAIITPWNYPAYMIARTAAAALAAGCPVVIRPSNQTPLTGLDVARAFADAGLPAGVLNIVTGDPVAIGQVLLDDERVRKIAFTGSVEVGKHLMRGAAKNIKGLSLELGGHAPFIVLSDADFDIAIESLMSTKFGHAGQMCIAPNRIYVHSSLSEMFLECLSSRVKKLIVGNGLDPQTDVGPLISQEAVEKVERHVNDAIGKGARLLVGGHRLAEGAYAAGSFYAPTILADVTPHMLITKEETFGPVAPVMAFETEEEVVRQANDSPYGLAGYLFTRDLSKAIHIAERLQCGVVGVNNTRVAAVEGPFGGVKQSGIGRESGHQGLERFLETKLIALGI